MTSPERLILVEDDLRLGQLVLRHLKESNFDVGWCTSAAQFDEMFESEPADLVIVDIMLPGEDGLSLCRRLRRSHDVGIIIVTARGEEADRIQGLELGADDYLGKPLSLWELEARVRAVLRRCARRTSEAVEAPGEAIILGDVVVDIDRRRVTRGGRELEITRSEFDILAMLASRRGFAFSRSRLLDAVLGGDSEASDRSVDTHVSNLRKKLEEDPKAPQVITTVWGVGYKIA